ncbi:hypothetical protein SMGD1_0289 [Sulfurimonas gotlandica GD1]|jgi:hypothetical protein|uniref:Uncharacterized protein n=1 Tax=Sulfurimonas gotlandica (strain DSM 19862 / JCM 16533 / GD1) TaxID=929558 RepID=B6BNL3_SULGG|nr:hypothetical protein [Sulfurimonas gotlandica]EDZ61273.1 conserved hypothetical protein [Sulfurimonas gotlandica GD1]EHP28816.1 hypothetical protein SMGD1_0289 [Sulfurimonas gotlandica GD1]
MSDKHELLDEVDQVLNKKKRLDFSYLVFILLLMSFVSLALFPKIYIQQQIYFKSRDISKLKGEYDTLVEENILINESVESIRFKNQILDTLF